MKTRTDVSYGIIPVRRQAGAWQTLLIQQYSNIGNNSYWVFPKGHAEGNETPTETAARELKEETGLGLERIMDTPSFTIHYTFTFNSELIQKQVTFFIGRVAPGELVLNPQEVVKADWLSLREAEQRLDYENAKAMFAEARQYLET